MTETTANDNVYFALRLPAEVRRKVEEIAQEELTTPSAVVRRAIARDLKRQQAEAS